MQCGVLSLPYYQPDALQVLVNGKSHAWPSIAHASFCQRINANMYSICVLFQRVTTGQNCVSENTHPAVRLQKYRFMYWIVM